MENKKTDAFGVTSEEKARAKDITPTFKLGEMKVGDSHRFTLLESLPRKIEIPDQEAENGKREEYAMGAIDEETGTEVTLWLSSKSLRMEFSKLKDKLGDLKNKKVVVAVRSYRHEKYGETRAYTVQEVRKEAEVQ